MRRIVLLAASLVLALSVAVGQDVPANGADGDQASQNNNPANAAQHQNPDLTTKSSSHSASVIRGCLSGSSGNYTLTDQNGMQYQVSGDDASLLSMVGREVEISGIRGQAGSASNNTNGVQASEVRAVSSTCHKAAAVSAPPPVGSGANTPSQADPAEAPQLHKGAKPSSSSPDGVPTVTPDRQ